MLGSVAPYVLGYAGMRGASKAQNRATDAQVQALKEKRMLQQLFGEQEMKRINADTGLEEAALKELHKLNENENMESQSLRRSLSEMLQPYMQEQQSILTDPKNYYAKQANLAKQSLFGEKAQQNINEHGNAVNNTFATRGLPQGSLSDNIKNNAANEYWKEAYGGFNDDYNRKQQQALHTLKTDYTDKLGNVTQKSDTARQKIMDMLGLGLGHSQRLSNATKAGLGLEVENTENLGDLRATKALNKGAKTQGMTSFLEMLLKSNDTQDINGYSDPREFLFDKSLSKDAGLSAEDMKTFQELRKLKNKKKNPAFIDIINNLDLFKTNEKPKI